MSSNREVLVHDIDSAIGMTLGYHKPYSSYESEEILSKTTWRRKKYVDDAQGTLRGAMRDDITRYLDFKTKFLTTTRSLQLNFAEEISSFYEFNVSDFLERPLVGIDEKGLSFDAVGTGSKTRAILTLPFGYLQNPGAWEENAVKRAHEIRVLADKAVAIIEPAMPHYLGGSWPFGEFGEFFVLDGQLDSQLGTRDFQRTYHVNYETGFVYKAVYPNMAEFVTKHQKWMSLSEAVILTLKERVAEGEEPIAYLR